MILFYNQYYMNHPENMSHYQESPDISIETDRALRQAVRDYIATEGLPYLLEGNKFAEAYEGPIHGVPDKSLIMGLDAESLTASAQTPDHDTALIVNIDLGPDSPAAIVNPGFVTKDNGTSAFRRSLVRFLTEAEGLALAEDFAIGNGASA